MRQTLFSINKYGRTKYFEVGDKVVASYYHEYEAEPNDYHSSFLKKLIDKPFKPVKCGVIVGGAGTRPFWLGKDSQEEYVYVRFKEYFFRKAIPLSCLEHTAEFIEQSEKYTTGNGKYVKDFQQWVSAAKKQLNKNNNLLIL